MPIDVLFFEIRGRRCALPVSVVYLVLYPGLGKFAGILDWSSASAYAKESAEIDAKT